MNTEKRLSALEGSMLPRMKTEALYNQIFSRPSEEQDEMIKHLSVEQIDALSDYAQELQGADAIDLDGFSDEELEVIAAGNWSEARIRERAKEVGAL